MILIPKNRMSQANTVTLLSGILKRTCSVSKKDNIDIESKKINFLNSEKFLKKPFIKDR